LPEANGVAWCAGVEDERERSGAIDTHLNKYLVPEKLKRDDQCRLGRSIYLRGASSGSTCHELARQHGVGADRSE
jgi:hypothetical protein